MAKHKLISFYLKTDEQIDIKIILLKEAARYNIRIEYFKNNDKIKETNNEVERSFVYQLFNKLDEADFETVSVQDDVFGCMRVYYGSQDYLEYHLNKGVLNDIPELKDILMSLFDFVDNSICNVDLNIKPV